MYYEEKCENGVYYFRSSPYRDWTPMTLQQVTSRCIEFELKYRKLQLQYDELECKLFHSTNAVGDTI